MISDSTLAHRVLDRLAELITGAALAALVLIATGTLVAMIEGDHGPSPRSPAGVRDLLLEAILAAAIGALTVFLPRSRRVFVLVVLFGALLLIGVYGTISTGGESEFFAVATALAPSALLGGLLAGRISDARTAHGGADA